MNTLQIGPPYLSHIGGKGKEKRKGERLARTMGVNSLRKTSGVLGGIRGYTAYTPTSGFF